MSTQEPSPLTVQQRAGHCRGEPTARRLAREAVSHRIGLAGQPSHRRPPLSSNVRPRRKRNAMHPLLTLLRSTTPPHELRLVDDVWNNKKLFVEWPVKPFLFMPGVARVERFHSYSHAQIAQIKAAKLSTDTRSNGPAVMAFGIAGGIRPLRNVGSRAWSVHHVYDGKYPAPGASTSVHAVKDGQLFTEAAGLVAVHPVADALADEVPYFAWLLRHEAFLRFGFNPDGVF